MKNILGILFGILVVVFLAGMLVGINWLKTSSEAKNTNPPRQQTTPALVDSTKAQPSDLK